MGEEGERGEEEEQRKKVVCTRWIGGSSDEWSENQSASG